LSISSDADDRLSGWIAGLEARHLSDLTFREVSRAVRALSSAYVERRATLGEGAALSGAGKRAAFALFYAPLHYLLIAHIVRHLPGAREPLATLIDLGCGTGASSAAWASQTSDTRRILAIDRHHWATGEAAETYRAFKLRATIRREDVATAKLPPGPAAILAAFTLNEMENSARDRVLDLLVDRASRGDRLLIVEPVAGFVARWWNRWRDVVERAGGRADEWRVRTELPPIVAKLDCAAGLNHREITGRSLWIGRSGVRGSG
jgi:hypothetical protein